MNEPDKTDERLHDEDVSRAYRALGLPGSPPVLDGRILRRAAAPGGGALLLRFAAVGLAATIVVGVGLELHTGRDSASEAAQDATTGSTPAAAPSAKTWPTSVSGKSEPRRLAGDGQAPPSGAESSVGEPVATGEACAEKRSSAQLWLNCIRALTTDGHNEDAAAERAALAHRFPDALIESSD